MDVDCLIEYLGYEVLEEVSLGATLTPSGLGISGSGISILTY